MSKSYTEKILFDKVSFGINEGDRVGVIGINGTGKSTLLKIIAGLEEPDEGTVTKGKKIRVEYLAQTPEFDSKLSILENAIQGKKAEEEYRNLEGEAKAMLERLGITDVTGCIDTLSGGQRKRVALVRTLLTPAEILVLDEPTNHLDHEMAEWLEEYLNKYRGAFVMITHDRYFLDKVTNKIVEIDKGDLYSYQGNYSKFLELKAQREEMEQATERKNKSLYRVELEWMMRGAKARSTKQKAHIQRFEELRDRKQIQEDQTIEVNALSSRLGKKTIELSHVSKSFGELNVIDDFSYIFLRGDRIGIIGPNGSGKSTLLKIITGNLPLDSGTIEIGETVKIGYFSQENEYMDDTVRVIDYMKEAGEYVQTSEGTVTASQMLDKFLFTGGSQYSLISKLSGGEKRRLYLLRILMEAPNVLILDEPTNDLDIKTLEILEDYLDSFPGIVVTVSHDRYFLDRVVQRIFAYEGNGKIAQYEGGFTDYKLALEERGKIPCGNTASEGTKHSAKDVSGKNGSKQKPRAPKLKFTYMEQKEYETIDSEIASLEQKIEALELQVEKEASNYTKLNEIMKEKETYEQQLEEKMERWVYLNDLAEQIEAEKNK